MRAKGRPKFNTCYHGEADELLFREPHKDSLEQTNNLLFVVVSLLHHHQQPQHQQPATVFSH